MYFALISRKKPLKMNRTVIFSLWRREKRALEENTMQNFDRIWDQVKQIVSEKISEGSFETWIRDLETIGFREGAAVIYTSSSYQRDIIKNRFMDPITEAFA